MTASLPVFVVKNGPTRGQRIVIDPVAKSSKGDPVFAIGTHPKADFVFDDPSLRPVHALIGTNSNGDYIITGRQGRVSVDGVQLFAPHKLQPGEIVTIGNTRLAFNLPLTAAQIEAEKHRRASQRHESGGAVFLWVMYGLVATIFGFMILYGIQSSNHQTASSSLPSGTVNVLFFYADWCTYCEQQRPTMAQLDRDYGSQVVVHYVDVDRSSNRDLERQYRVRGIPHTVVLDRDGNVEANFVGYTSRGTIENALRRAYD